jgi:hypothetical protein
MNRMGLIEAVSQLQDGHAVSLTSRVALNESEATGSKEDAQQEPTDKHGGGFAHIIDCPKSS